MSDAGYPVVNLLLRAPLRAFHRSSREGLRQWKMLLNAIGELDVDIR